MRHWTAAALAAFLFACGGGGGGDGGTSTGGCTGSCGTASPSALTVTDVQRVVSQAVQEAQARSARGTIAVVDRVGNVLAVFQMSGAATTFTISGGRGISGGLEGAVLASEYAAISKAMTAAYLSSEGNAFSTRTASQIIQENFNPGEVNGPGGPLFGVQFSSLSCSDVTRTAAAGTAGPKGSPLGLAGDPGGLPLYKNGTVVGGIGVIADGVYGIDRNVNDVDADIDELIAIAGASGFDAPVDRRADRITADGRTLRYVDSQALVSNPAAAPAYSSLPGALLRVPGYFDPGAISAGVAYATAASGLRADASAAFAGLGAYVLDDGSGTNRYPPVAGTDGLLTQTEVTAILAEALKITNRARAQIRRPLGTTPEVSISVVDTRGAVLGFVRTRDAPVFGIDVAVQKARTALFFSQSSAATDLSAVSTTVAGYVANMQAFIPGGSALTDGIAYSNRAIGNLARPFFPDGINGSGPGPLSRSFTSWSPFSDGLQLELVSSAIVANLGRTPAAPCVAGLPRIANGIQIFPGSVPIYRGNTLVGAIGVSGDGVDQDDMIAFLGLANAGRALGTGIANAPAALRADRITLTGGQLRYVNCPIAPFLDTNESNVCTGL
ncbi:MAG: GlcG/HbpS family heme-binding protein [Rhodospirillaceae bacterium]